MMKKQENTRVRKVWSIIWRIALFCDIFYMTIRYIHGQLTGLGSVLLFAIYVVIVAQWVINTILKLIDYVLNIHAFCIFKKQFKYLENVHKTRYKLYFSSANQQQIQLFSEFIENFGKDLIVYGEHLLKSTSLSHRINKKISESIDRTKQLMTREQP